ncbi:hypothetical protein NL676_006467 [Syzygium grande]|nr:hypothetical protein NL676_006467 [Syzygium grande]
MVDIQEDSSFHFVLSPLPTPVNLHLMKHLQWAANEEIEKLNHIEICPTVMDLTQIIAKRISSDGGGALIIDYGLNGVISDSLQAIRKHKFVNILDDPGSTDLSAYVDFATVKHSARGGIRRCFGSWFDHAVSVPGCSWDKLQSRSIATELYRQTSEVFKGWVLVTGGRREAPFWEGPDEQVPIRMGTRYLVMAIVNKKQGVPVPFS